MNHSTLRRLATYSLIGSVLLGAGLSIAFVLLNAWGWFTLRVVATAACVAVTSLCIMACELAKTPKGMNLFPHAGFAITGLATAMLLLGIWDLSDGVEFWRLTSTLCGFAVATVHVCLISVAPLARRFKWVYLVAMQISFGLATLFSILIFELYKAEEGTVRLMIVLAIADTALTLIIPLLSKISRNEGISAELQTALEQRNLAAIDDEICMLKKRLVILEKLRESILPGSAHAQPREIVS
jgi:hypothetical protein